MEGFLGQIILWSVNNRIPENWLPCNGKLLDIEANQDLYFIMGTRNGGDGRITFALPSLSTENENLVYIICVDGLFPERSDNPVPSSYWAEK